MDDYLLSDEVVPVELIEEAKKVSQPHPLHRVYFNADTREILAISNEEVAGLSHFFEVDSLEITEVLEKGQVHLYMVDLDSNEKPKVVLKPTVDLFVPTLLKAVRVDNWDCELTVEQYLYSKTWGFHLRADRRTKLKFAGINSKLEFFIIDPENRNFIINTITFNFQHLCENKRVFIPFSYYKEEDSNIEVYTKSFFKTTGLVTLYDTKN